MCRRCWHRRAQLAPAGGRGDHMVSVRVWPAHMMESNMLALVTALLWPALLSALPVKEEKFLWVSWRLVFTFYQLCMFGGNKKTWPRIENFYWHSSGFYWTDRVHWDKWSFEMLVEYSRLDSGLTCHISVWTASRLTCQIMSRMSTWWARTRTVSCWPSLTRAACPPPGTSPWWRPPTPSRGRLWQTWWSSEPVTNITSIWMGRSEVLLDLDQYHLWCGRNILMCWPYSKV